MNRIDIRPDHLKIVQGILNTHLSNDVKVWIYGSRAKWTTLDSSDLDLALEGAGEIDDRVMNQLRRDFEASDLPYEVDIVDLLAVPSSFKNMKKKDKVLLDRFKDNDVALQGQGRDLIPEGWKEVRLGDFYEVLFGQSPESKYYNKYGQGLPFYQGKTEFTTGKFIGETKIWTSKAIKIAIKDDILMSVRTPVGPVNISREKICIGRGLCAIRPKKANGLFLFYSLKFLENKIRKYSSGSVFESINRQQVEKFQIWLPPPDEQKAIADILGSLDDKIEQNQRMNNILEGMAQAIFKSWFVDFDPVHAKSMALEAGLSVEQAKHGAMAVIAGVCSPQEFAENPKRMNHKLDEKLSCMSQNQRDELTDVASLFPSEFKDSELGPIPKGWHQSTIGNEFNIKMGQSPKGSSYNTLREGTLFFQGRKDFGFRFPKERMFTTAPNRIAKEGDTLISVRAPVGDRNMAIKDCCIGRGLASLRHKNKSSTYTYYLISHIEKSLDILGGSGTVFNSINKDNLSNVKITAPSDILIKKYNDLIRSFDDKIKVLSIESNYLIEVRDALLPKLLSGEIDVSKIKTKEVK